MKAASSLAVPVLDRTHDKHTSSISSYLRIQYVKTKLALKYLFNFTYSKFIFVCFFVFLFLKSSIAYYKLFSASVGKHNMAPFLSSHRPNLAEPITYHFSHFSKRTLLATTRHSIPDNGCKLRWRNAWGTSLCSKNGLSTELVKVLTKRHFDKVLHFGASRERTPPPHGTGSRRRASNKIRQLGNEIKKQNSNKNTDFIGSAVFVSTYWKERNAMR